jgi:protoporphyrinogen oxidase
VSENEHQVIIVGAGLSGLSAAAELEKNGIASLVIGASDRVGGRVQSDEVDGFILDRGFQVFLSTYSETRAMAEGLQLYPFRAGAVIWDGEKRRRVFDPRRHPEELLNSLCSGVFTLSDYLRLLQLTQKPLSPGVTIRELEARGFSASSLERFFRPFFSGVLLDPELIVSTESFNFAFKNFLKGQAMLPAGGMRMLPETIAASLRSSGISLNTKVEAVSRNEVVLANRRKLKAQVVVLATDADEATRLLALPEKCQWRGVTTMYFATESSFLEENVLLLNGSGRGLINSLFFPSDVAPGYAPEGKSLLSVTTLRNCSEKEVVNELEIIFPNCSCRHLKTYRIPRALPGRISATISDIFVCGDYLDVPSIENAVVSGKRAAEYALQRMGR